MRYFLETDKIGLKKLEQLEVTQEYVDWLNDEVVTQTLVAGKLPTGLEDLSTYVTGANKPGTITFAIYRKDTAKHIGNVKLDHIDWISRKADFGILLGDKDSWGKGFGFDATKTVIDYAFQTLNLNRVYLGVLEGNPNAKRIYQKVGFLTEGERIQDQYCGGRYENCAMMGITRSRWLSVNKRVVIIIQARMSSSRLEGKVLLPLEGKPMLVHIAERARRSKKAVLTIVATSVDPSDDPIQETCKTYGIPCFRGSLNDVLERYGNAAEAFEADIIVRVTGDCPLIDPEVIDNVIETYLENIEYVDYASNMDFPTFPDGLDTEVFSIRALRRSLKESKLPSEREHVTLYIRKNMRKINLPLEGKSYAHFRWSVDEEEDYRLIQTIYKALYREHQSFGYRDVIAFLETHPEYLKLNAHIPINEGLMKSLQNENQ